MPGDHLKLLSDEYGRADAVFLSTLRAKNDRASMALAARVVADAGRAFNTEAYRKLHAWEGDV